MARDFRVERDGQRWPFSCENWRFRTTLAKGFAHGVSGTRGSVLPAPLVAGDYSLWLEHVESKQEDGQRDWYWLMWYDPEGNPTIPLSGVLTRDQLCDMVRHLLQFAPQ